MKTTPLLLVLSVGIAAILHAEGNANYTPESRTSSEVFASKVLKIYSFQDGDLEYVAYVVNWRDHEVVVAPLGMPGGEKRYDVGDTVRCQMQQVSHRLGDSAKARVIFMLIANFSGADGMQRLQALEGDIEARRAARRQSSEPPPPPKNP